MSKFDEAHDKVFREIKLIVQGMFHISEEEFQKRYATDFEFHRGVQFFVSLAMSDFLRKEGRHD